MSVFRLVGCVVLKYGLFHDLLLGSYLHRCIWSTTTGRTSLQTTVIDVDHRGLE